MSRYEFKCPECNGEGEVLCECCGNTTECEVCEGEGVDIAKVDMEKFKEATKAFSGSQGSWALVENNIWVGRTDGKTNVYYRNFLKKENTTSSPAPS